MHGETQHDRIEEDIPGYVRGDLDAASARRLEAHLRDCEECAAAVESIRRFAEEIRDAGEALFSPHPDVATLRRAARRRGGGKDDSLDRHLACCASCSLEMSILRRRAATRSVPAWATALAAGLILGLGLGWLASWFGRSTVSEVSGFVDLPVVHGVRRGDFAPAVVSISPGQEGIVLPLAIDPAGIVRQVDDGALLFLRIRDREGRIVHQASIAGEELKRRVSETGVLGVMAPAARMAAGPYRVTLGPEDMAAPLFQGEFVVE